MNKELKTMVESFEDPRVSLIKILQKAQEMNSYLSEEIIKEISEYSKIPPTEILGVITFYSQFKLNPVGKHIIKICEGTACHVNNVSKIKAAILEHLNVKEKEITKDGFYSVECVACLGCCSLAPVIMIDDQAFGNLTGTSVVKLLDDYKENNK